MSYGQMKSLLWGYSVMEWAVRPRLRPRDPGEGRRARAVCTAVTLHRTLHVARAVGVRFVLFIYRTGEASNRTPHDGGRGLRASSDRRAEGSTRRAPDRT